MKRESKPGGAAAIGTKEEKEALGGGGAGSSDRFLDVFLGPADDLTGAGLPESLTKTRPTLLSREALRGFRVGGVLSAEKVE